MKRAVIFAHYDKDAIIDDYVIYYLKELNKITDTIVFVSCCELSDNEIEKVKTITPDIIAKFHDEYDFGSYKRGFLYLKEKLDEFDELIFANDSCYGPLYPLKNVFDKMEDQNCDFWGITKNRLGIIKKHNGYNFIKREHLQSYFLVFKQNIFMSEIFQNFISSIKHYDNKNDIIINYEIGLTELLHAKGFSSSYYIKAFNQFSNTLIYFWRPLIRFFHMPFIKCIVLRNPANYMTTIQDWQNILQKNTNYPIEIIEKNLIRTKLQSLNIDNELKFLIKKYFCYFIAIQPKITKNLFTKFYNKFML